ncbi:MAG TPA: nucleotidyltransferase family protein [Ktedonobacterales bacterium]|nr:nucleotidyltransferase family protein [Ktedonobacterales bacterium]
MTSSSTHLSDVIKARQAHDQSVAHMVAILRAYGVPRASLFGSFARGDQGPESDVDLVIEPPPGTTLFSLARLGDALETAVGRRVDLITFNALEQSASSRLRQRIQHDMEALPL